MHGPANSILGPAACKSCGRSVWWARSITRETWNGAQIPGWLTWRDQSGGVHSCEKRPRLVGLNGRKRTWSVVDGRRVYRAVPRFHRIDVDKRVAP